MADIIENLETALKLLGARLDLAQAPAIGLVVCGGSALIALGLIKRTTRDVDVLALMNSSGDLISPDPLPSYLLDTANVVARDLRLAPDWLNNGPSRDAGGIFQLGYRKALRVGCTRAPMGIDRTRRTKYAGGYDSFRSHSFANGWA